MKIATWNVNSLRVRLPHVLNWLGREQPDVLAVQETKMSDPEFPVAELAEAGYRSLYSGQKTYNGVAVFSKFDCCDSVTDPAGFDDPQRRILAVTIDDYRIVNLYVPNGGEVGSDKYVYKLDWLARMRDYLSLELERHPRLVVLGDFNIAPEDRDVYDPESWRERILCSTPEREAFRALLDLGLIDVFRRFDQAEKSYTWWDYRLNAFRRNMGLRIDHILVSALLADDCSGCHIDVEPRKLERPSDHAPVVAEFRA